MSPPAEENLLLKWEWRTSLVVQWLRIRLPTQGTRVRAPAREDPTCRGATKPLHNYWACALGPASHNYWDCVPQLLKPACLEPVPRNKRSHRNEKPAYRNKDPMQPKKKLKKKKRKWYLLAVSRQLFYSDWLFHSFIHLIGGPIMWQASAGSGIQQRARQTWPLLSWSVNFAGMEMSPPQWKKKIVIWMWMRMESGLQSRVPGF